MKKLLLFLIGAALLQSCSQSPDNAKLLLGRWKGLKIEMAPSESLSDEEKAQIQMANQMIAGEAGSFEMSFNDDGSFEMKDAQNQNQTGSYSLEDNGKRIKINQPGLDEPYFVSIETLNSDTLVYLMNEFPDSNMTMMLKHVRYEFVR